MTTAVHGHSGWGPRPRRGPGCSCRHSLAAGERGREAGTELASCVPPAVGHTGPRRPAHVLRGCTWRRAPRPGACAHPGFKAPRLPSWVLRKKGGPRPSSISQAWCPSGDEKEAHLVQCIVPHQKGPRPPPRCELSPRSKIGPPGPRKPLSGDSGKGRQRATPMCMSSPEGGDEPCGSMGTPCPSLAGHGRRHGRAGETPASASDTLRLCGTQGPSGSAGTRVSDV